MRIGQGLIGILPAFVVIALLVSAGGFNGEMVFDSHRWIQENAAAFETGSLVEVLKIFPPRPFAMLTFHFNYLLAGMEPYYFRVGNALILAGTAFVLFVLIQMTLSIHELKLSSSGNEKIFVAVLAALAFLVHPVQSFIVLYVIQRMTLLACFFSLASLTAYVATRTGRIPSRIAGYGASFVFFICGLLSKEIAITVPAIMLLAELVLFKRIPRLSARALVACLALAAIVLVPLNLIQRIPTYGKTGVLDTIARNYQVAELNLWETVLSQCRVTFDYAWLVIAPFFSHAPLIKPMVVSRSLFVPPVTVAASLGVLALVVAVFACARRRPLTSFGIGFFLTTLVLEAFAVPQNLYFCHRAALPMVGIIFVAVDWSLAIVQWGREHGRYRWIPVGVLATFYAFWLAAIVATTVTRADMWQDPVLVWEDSMKALPKNEPDVEKFPKILIFNGLGEVLRRAGQPAQAIQLHRRALELDSWDGQTWMQLGTAYWQLEDSENARRSFEAALKLMPNDALVHNNIGAILFKDKQFKQALKHFQEAARLQPSNPLYRRRLAVLFLFIGKPEQAAVHLRRTIELQTRGPELAVDHFNLGKILRDTGKLREAIAHLEKAVEIEPNMWEGHHTLGSVLVRLGRLEKGVEHLEKALELNPLETRLKNDLGQAKRELSKRNRQ